VIHTYSLNEYNIAIDGNSGSIHVLDDITCEILKMKKKCRCLQTYKKNLKRNIPPVKSAKLTMKSNL